LNFGQTCSRFTLLLFLSLVFASSPISAGEKIGKLDRQIKTIVDNSQLVVSTALTPVRLIFDTDIGPDCDDAGAAAVLHALANLGEVDILAMMVSTGGPTAKWGPPCLDAINTFYGRPDIPIGVLKAAGPQDSSKYNRQIAQEFPNDLKSGDNAPEATGLYRKILAKQPDHSVVIVTVGYLSNLRHLLDSNPDRYSKLNGLDLVARKVKLWCCMGGTYPRGKEWNFHRDPAASERVVNAWPTPVVFSGFEIGNAIHVGARLQTDTPKTNPIRRAYQLHTGGKNGQSWDQTAVLYAVRGHRGGLANVWDVEAKGHNHANRNGTNEWRAAPDRDHSYLIEKMPPADVAALIEKLMLQPPAVSGTKEK
jgi:inosine-uridine nucleoside N-ribohydrolase